jgi:hypothetical protein
MSLSRAFMTCALVVLAGTTISELTEADFELIRISEQKAEEFCMMPSMGLIALGDYALKAYPQGKYVRRECEEARMRSYLTRMTGKPSSELENLTGETR